jgi:alkanesulfonate monooxygenase SsuD/methylene tetrahydromethanopterin reductase-like flavin-dependent oxidoreductase (luciferase family)
VTVGDVDVTQEAATGLDRRVDKETTAVLGSPHPLKLAVFSANMAGGANLTHSPDALRLTWPESVAVARLADQVGFEAMIPVARWRGMGDPAHRPGHRSFETFTWAAAVAAVTERIQVFATFHVPVLHPVAAAKQIATVDHISGGRFAVNIVAGWNEDEFQMFGLDQRPHDDRYAYAGEWVEFLQRIWSATEEFDFHGRHLHGVRVLSEPKPVQRPGPVIMNAGFSPSGQEFAARHADVTFALIPSVEAAAGTVRDLKRRARDTSGRELRVFTAAHVVCAETNAEAQRQFDRMLHEFGDWEAARNAVRLLIPNSQSADFDQQGMAASAIAGFFALPLVGSPATIAEKMAEMSAAGLDGLALSWLDYTAGIEQYRDQLLPLLVQAGVRKG